jgi:hypothetical protein
MTVTRDIVIREAKILAVFLGLSIVQTMFTCPRCNSVRSYVVVCAFTVLMWVFLWRGNSIITDYLSARIPWLHYPVKRFLLGLTTTVIYSLAAILLLMNLFQAVFNFNFGNSYLTTVYASVGLTVLISLFLHSREFLLFWRLTTLEAEKLQREKMSAQYENLKSRVNPQLLFNSLATLRELVPKDKENAVRFIKHLSDVYRYILDSRGRETIPATHEYRFLDSYLFLLRQRFGSSISFDIRPVEEKYHLSPLAIQLIIESVVDHSEVNTDHPATFTVEAVDRFLVITSLSSVKESGKENISAVMDNIVQRYSFLTKDRVGMEISPQRVTIRLPLIEVHSLVNDKYA